MRRRDREVTQINDLLNIINTCKVCRIGAQDEEGIYIVPMNFGYTYEDEELTLFFHSAKKGRKIDAFKKNPKVCFEMDCGHQLIEDETPCENGYYFQSIIGNGNVEFINDIEGKKHALAALMKHQTGRDVSFNDKMVDSVAVFKIEVSSFSGKAHQ